MFGLKGDAKGLFLQLAKKAGKNPEDFIKQLRKDKNFSGELTIDSSSGDRGFNIGGGYNTGKFKKGGKVAKKKSSSKPRGVGIALRGYGRAMKGTK